jgi:alpha-1,2-mannosyltransferase
VAASFAPIQDCDETFNYWEPTHYLSHGYGLQTWEYSPTYAIRSWTYIGIHAIIGNLRRLLPRSNKIAEFYFVRYALAGFCAFCQANLFTVISSTLHPRVGLFFVLATISSPGNFHASAAYLPSSFAMYMGMLAMACFLDWRGGVRTSMGMFWSAMGGILGWPFAAALCLPFIAEEAFLGLFSMGEGLQHAVVRGIRGAMSAVVITVSLHLLLVSNALTSAVLGRRL